MADAENRAQSVLDQYDFATAIADEIREAVQASGLVKAVLKVRCAECAILIGARSLVDCHGCRAVRHALRAI